MKEKRTEKAKGLCLTEEYAVSRGIGRCRTGSAGPKIRGGKKHISVYQEHGSRNLKKKNPAINISETGPGQQGRSGGRGTIDAPCSNGQES